MTGTTTAYPCVGDRVSYSAGLPSTIKGTVVKTGLGPTGRLVRVQWDDGKVLAVGWTRLTVLR